jgi:hypothetical protein
MEHLRLFLVLSCTIASLFATAQIKPTTIDSAKVIGSSKSSLATEEPHVPQAPKSIQSPNVSTLGSYGEIAVSPYTGKPEVNVNLHTVSSGEVQIPIALHYDAAGVRPDVHPGWTGLNFGISTIYSVTRTIRDGPDEFNIPGVILEQLGYNFTYIVNSGNNWALPDTIKKTALTISTQQGSPTGSFVDTEPDEYSFNLPSVSGKFYFGSDGLWKVQCDRPVKVERITTQNIHLYTPFTPPASIKDSNPWLSLGHYMEHFQGFTITDEFGTKYIFGGSDMSGMEYSIDFFDQGKDGWTCNAWYLRSIVRQTGQTINFTYERGAFVNQMYFSVYNKMSKIDGGWWFSCSNWSSLFTEYGPYSGKLISPIYLAEISSDNFKVKFTSTESTELRYTNDIFTTYENKKILDNYSKLDFLTFLYDCYYPTPNNYPGGCGSPTLTQLLAKLKWRKLDKIQIQNGAGSTIKEFEFTYNNVATERLMLQKVQEKSGYNANKLPAYEFTYFTNGYTLPAYCKSHTDHWGFNNGKLINVPTDYNNIATYGNNFRSPDPNENLYRVGSLTQIKYPTGGITKFRFEAHKYSKEVKLKRWQGEDPFATNQLAGGLRIKEIQSYDPGLMVPAVTKKYYYLATFNPASPDTSSSVLSSGILGGKAQYYWPDYMPLPDDPSITVLEDIFSTQSVLPASENSMGSHIGYSQVIERSSTEGWIVHKFSNFDNGYRDEAPSGFLQPSSTPYQPYNNKAFTRGKQLSEEHFFQNGNLSAKTTHLYNLVGTLNEHTAPSVKTQFTPLCGTANAVFEGTAYLIDCRKFLATEVVHYSYDQDNGAAIAPSVSTYSYWPNGQLYVTGKSDSKSRTIKTWYKYPHNFADAVSVAMVGKNIIGPVREILNYTGTEAAPSPIKTTAVSYDVFSGAYLPKKVETKIGNAPSFNTDIEFLSYDPRGNLLTFKKQNGPVTKLEYYGTVDIGKVDQLKTLSVADGTTVSQTTSYNYKPSVGVESIQDANAKAEFNEFDDFNRLKKIHSNNAGGPVRATYCYNYAGQVVDCAALAPTGSVAATGLVLIAEDALPVTLIDFFAKRQEKTSLLTWITASEANSDRFDIERSADGRQWQKIGSIPSHTESNEQQSYGFTDYSPLAGENLYRLKMVDLDSTFAYSRIQSVVFDEAGKIVLYPNPHTVHDRLTIQTTNPERIDRIQIFDVTGQEIMQSPWKPNIDVSKLTRGLHIVQITYTDGSISTHRIVKQ